MRKLLFLIPTLILCFLVQSISAQDILTRTKNRAKYKTQNKVDNEVDKTIDEGLDAIGNLFKKKNKKAKTTEEIEETDSRSAEEAVDENQQNNNIENTTSQPVERDEGEAIPFKPNDFICSFNYNMRMYKNGKEKTKDNTTVKVVLDRTQTAIQMSTDGKEQQMLVVLENEDRTMVTVPDISKSTAMRIKQRGLKNAYEYEQEDYKITRTGEYKTIEGYKCEKVIVEDEEYRTEAWITLDHEVNYHTMMNSIWASAGNKKAGQNGFGEAMGFPLESVAKSLDGKEEIHTKITELSIGNIDRSIFDLSKYEIMQVPIFGK